MLFLGRLNPYVRRSTVLSCCTKPMTAKGWVYTLALEGGCYYCGFSTKPEVRVSSHFLTRGTQWNRLHPTVSVMSVQPCDVLLERTVTLACMIEHGYQNVKGGPWLAIQLLASPPSIQKAYELRRPPPLPQLAEPETIKDNALLVLRINIIGILLGGPK